MVSSGLSTFSKLVRICFIEIVGFQVSSFSKLSPRRVMNEPESLLNIAFKKYVWRALESEVTKNMLMELMLNENLTADELSFVSEYPDLYKAAMKRAANIQNEQRDVLQTVDSGRRPTGNSERVKAHRPLTRTHNVLETLHPLVANRRTVERSKIEELRQLETQQPSSSNEELRGSRVSGVEEVITGRKKQPKKKRQNQQNQNGFQKNSPKSFYNYKNNTKFMHCRL
uniref:Uncharacterized protein n=1 Tax=Caenorhabditis tropicalis TaxID=1561998 RepID=A0A1I7TLA4_9PELO